MQNTNPDHTNCLCNIKKICAVCDVGPCEVGIPFSQKSDAACMESNPQFQCKCCKCIRCPMSVIKRLCQLALMNVRKEVIAKERYSIFEGGRSLDFGKKPLHGCGDFIYKRKTKTSDYSSDESKTKRHKFLSKEKSKTNGSTDVESYHTPPDTKSPSPKSSLPRRRVTVDLSDSDTALRTPEKKKRQKSMFVSSKISSESDSNEHIKSRKRKTKKLQHDSAASYPKDGGFRQSKLTGKFSKGAVSTESKEKGDTNHSKVLRKASKGRDSHKNITDKNFHEVHEFESTRSDDTSGNTLERNKINKKWNAKSYLKSDKETATVSMRKIDKSGKEMYPSKDTETFKKQMQDEKEPKEKINNFKIKSTFHEDQTSKKQKLFGKKYVEDEQKEMHKITHDEGRKPKRQQIELSAKEVSSSESTEDDGKRIYKRPLDRRGGGKHFLELNKGKIEKTSVPHEITYSRKSRRDDSNEADLISLSTSRESESKNRPKRRTESSIIPDKFRPWKKHGKELYRDSRTDISIASPSSFDSVNKIARKRKQDAENKKWISDKFRRNIFKPKDSDGTRRNKDNVLHRKGDSIEEKFQNEMLHRSKERTVPDRSSLTDGFQGNFRKLKCSSVKSSRADSVATSDWMRLRLEVADQRRLKEICRLSENKMRPECNAMKKSCVLQSNPSCEEMRAVSHSIQAKDAVSTMNPLSYCYI